MAIRTTAGSTPDSDSGEVEVVLTVDDLPPGPIETYKADIVLVADGNHVDYVVGSASPQPHQQSDAGQIILIWHDVDVDNNPAFYKAKFKCKKGGKCSARVQHFASRRDKSDLTHGFIEITCPPPRPAAQSKDS